MLVWTVLKEEFGQLDQNHGGPLGAPPRRFEPTLGQRLAGHFLSVFTTIGVVVVALANFSFASAVLVASSQGARETLELILGLLVTWVLLFGFRVASSVAHILSGNLKVNDSTSFPRELLWKLFLEGLIFQGFVLIAVAALSLLVNLERGGGEIWLSQGFAIVFGVLLIASSSVAARWQKRGK